MFEVLRKLVCDEPSPPAAAAFDPASADSREIAAMAWRLNSQKLAADLMLEACEAELKKRCADSGVELFGLGYGRVFVCRSDVIEVADLGALAHALGERWKALVSLDVVFRVDQELARDMLASGDLPHVAFLRAALKIRKEIDISYVGPADYP